MEEMLLHYKASYYQWIAYDGDKVKYQLTAEGEIAQAFAKDGKYIIKQPKA